MRASLLACMSFATRASARSALAIGPLIESGTVVTSVNNLMRALNRGSRISFGTSNRSINSAIFLAFLALKRFSSARASLALSAVSSRSFFGIPESMSLRNSVMRSCLALPVRSASSSKDPPSPALDVQSLRVQTSFSRNHTTACRSSSPIFASLESWLRFLSPRMRRAAASNTSWPMPNCSVVSPLGSMAPLTPLSAALGTRTRPAIRWSSRAAHTSIVARVRNPIRLPLKLSALGAVSPRPMSGLAASTVRHRFTAARTAFMPLNPNFFAVSLRGTSASGNSRRSDSAEYLDLYSGRFLIAALVMPGMTSPDSRVTGCILATFSTHATHWGIIAS